MISGNERHSNYKSLQLIKTNNALTSRSAFEQEINQSNRKYVSPWAGDQYFNNLKKEIKNEHAKKKSESKGVVYERFLQETPEYQRSKRVKTVNLEMSPITTQQQKLQWNKIMPKKSSAKVLFRELNLIEKLEAQQKLQGIERKHSQQSTIHNRKTSLKYFPHAKPKKTRIPTDYDYNNAKKIQQQSSLFGRLSNKKNNLFYFETKNKARYSNRQKMVMKIRNLQRGRVDRALTNQF